MPNVTKDLVGVATFATLVLEAHHSSAERSLVAALCLAFNGRHALHLQPLGLIVGCNLSFLPDDAGPFVGLMPPVN